MANVRINSRIAQSVRALSKTEKFVRKFGKHTMRGFVTESIRYFLDKHKECFACPDHKDVVAGLELGRQSLASTDSSDPIEFSYVQCDPDILKRADEYSARYNRTLRVIVEQAILEHLTRPSRCAKCPFYEEMRAKVQPVEQLGTTK